MPRRGCRNTAPSTVCARSSATLALRTAPRSHRSRLPANVRRPHPGPEDDAAVTGNEREQAMTQVDPAETGEADGRRDTGSGTWRAGIRRAIRIGSRPEPWKRGPVLPALALLLGLFSLLHAQ